MPEYHPNEHPGLIFQVTPTDLGPRKELLAEKHAEYIASFAKVCSCCFLFVHIPGAHALALVEYTTVQNDMQKTSKDWEYVYSDHFRMSGVYWALTALALLPGQPVSKFMAEDDLVAWIMSCKKEDGSFGHNEYHDGCLLATLSAVQIMVLLGRVSDLDADGIAGCTINTEPILLPPHWADPTRSPMPMLVLLSIIIYRAAHLQLRFALLSYLLLSHSMLSWSNHRITVTLGMQIVHRCSSQMAPSPATTGARSTPASCIQPCTAAPSSAGCHPWTSPPRSPTCSHARIGTEALESCPALRATRARCSAALRLSPSQARWTG